MTSQAEWTCPTLPDGYIEALERLARAALAFDMAYFTGQDPRSHWHDMQKATIALRKICFDSPARERLCLAPAEGGVAKGNTDSALPEGAPPAVDP